MTAMRRRPFTGPVALDLQFYTKRRNPPAIHQLAKHVLDLLGPADAAVRPRRRSVLYRDDRQVKFLDVGLHQGWDLEDASGETTGWSTLVARPVRDVASDLQLAQRLSHDDWDAKEDESSPFYSPKFRDGLDRALDPPSGDRASWSWVDEFSVYFDRMQTQTAVLARTDAALLTGLCTYLDSLSDTAGARSEGRSSSWHRSPHSPELCRGAVRMVGEVRPQYERPSGSRSRR
ncbi:hypothetical protein ACFYOK_00315 [Microbispora bryophytorum]|uniref:hypothetical protein n=1 Tax=Microbispora bryophytorum TaxID=1460882 RepID=UPI0033FD766A